MTVLKVTMPKQMQDWVEAEVAKGFYMDASDLVRDLIRERVEMEREYEAYRDNMMAEFEDDPLDDMLDEVAAKSAGLRRRN